MDLKPSFAYQPTPPVPVPTPGPPPPSPAPPAPSPSPAPPSPPAPAADLGPLSGLLGEWQGSGFNTIWRPSQSSAGSDHFLELNLTSETIEFDAIPGSIPNRGLLQADLQMMGLRYLQQITDSNLSAGLHAEPGVWLNVPATTDPPVPESIVRLGNVPHGTSFVAQGVASSGTGPPTVPAASIAPFPVGNPSNPETFAEQQLASQSNFRTTGTGLNGISQPMLDNPNSVLTSVLSQLSVGSFIELSVSTDAATPILGGGTANSAFLGGGADGPNAVAARIDATFWLLTLQTEAAASRLLYTQTVLLNFNGISWPHVTVGSLALAPPAP